MLGKSNVLFGSPIPESLLMQLGREQNLINLSKDEMHQIKLQLN